MPSAGLKEGLFLFTLGACFGYALIGDSFRLFFFLLIAGLGLLTVICRFQ
jgi:hypothetical protein